MKSKMSQIGIGLAALSALAAEGKDFDRAELNAMLDKLAASPEPKVRRGPQATCYSMAMPRPEECIYKCPKCGAVTKYFNAHFNNTLAFYRDGAVQLKALGLDISLDESSLCQVCTPGQPKPVSGYLKTDAGNGEKVRIINYRDGRYIVRVIKRENVVEWIERKAVSNDVVVANHVYVRISPDPESGAVVHTLFRGDSVKMLPRVPEDPEDMIRIDASPFYLGKWMRVLPEELTDIDYGDGSLASDDRIDNLHWIICGKRVKAQRSDVEILKTFLSGGLVYHFGHGEEMPMQRQLPRLRELLGEPKK
ncbi:MAG: hypothetical protein E7049_13420 [Lentisphaerae bacterium]|nr:hypothetical protein [Lentisphaerota bacterium]